MNPSAHNARRSRSALITVVIAVAVIAGTSIWLLRAPAAPQVSGTTIAGQAVGPQTLQGRPYLVNFWATSCVTCVKEMPELIAVHKEFEARGYLTVAVAMSYDRPDYIETFVKDRGIPFLVIHDKDNAWTQAYGNVAVTPTTFVVNRDGKVIKRYVGEPNFSELRKILARELG
jgi:peroxiredoxin